MKQNRYNYNMSIGLLVHFNLITSLHFTQTEIHFPKGLDGGRRDSKIILVEYLNIKSL